jgi:NTP pyrophosphatase (non-canonical NTP hydrolase)
MINAMTLQELQEQVDSWIRQHGVRYFNELTNMTLLVEEVGEMARLMARQYGEQSFKEGEEHLSLEDEIGDVLFVLTCIANQTGVDMTRAISNSMVKKSQRDNLRHKRNPKLK